MAAPSPPRWLEKLIDVYGDTALEKIIHGDKPEPPVIEKLLTTTPLHLLAAAADYYARTVKGNTGSFTVNLYVTYTNVCVTACSFCAFYRPPGHREAYTRSPREIAWLVKRAAERHGIIEVHMVGGNNPDLPLDYYVDLLEAVKSAAPGVRLKAFTAEEVWFIARSTGHSVREVLETFRMHGLDALSGGGTEILDEEVEKIIAPKKISPEEYLRVHEEAHRLGIRSNVIIMYGHVEEPIHVARHLYRVRLLEEKQPGFTSIIPVRFNPGGTPLARTRLYRERARLDGEYDLRIAAAARLALLGAVDNVVAYWVSMGDKLAQAALSHGANDLGGTFYNEAVVSATRGRSSGGKSPRELAYMLRQAWWTPWLRDTFYNYLARAEGFETPWLLEETR